MAIERQNLEDMAKGYDNLVFKFARAVLPASRSLVWDGANGQYNGWLSSESIVTVVSSSADDKAGSGGATVLVIKGQGTDGIEKEEEIILNGITPVNSVGLFDIVYSARVKESEDKTIDGGAGTGPNHGEIDIYQQGQPTNIMAKIPAQKGRTQMATYRVPSNKYGEFKRISVTPVGNKQVLVELYARENKNAPWNVQGSVDTLSNPSIDTLVLPRLLTPGTDLCLIATATQAGTSVSSSLEVKLYDIEED